MTSPKPGDPAFTPRYPPLDLAPIRQRIEERREAAKLHPMREVLDADTDMMAELVLAVTNLRLALEIAKGLHRAAVSPAPPIASASVDDPYAPRSEEVDELPFR